ncbi:hypothetical protein DY000_02017305 [Brassica cretica]|uniref:Uncharacterized protein n=1 Tax=Brassica cretica TaxID=69181 RepID=A0ABQ7D2D6_BRACR|nr:hypothetical protein DY000_02017305 [Brassica cretica]
MSPQRQPEVARVFDVWVLENALGATSKSDGTKSLQSRATLSQRHLEVARVCDVLERKKWAGSDVPRATPSGRFREQRPQSDTLRSLAFMVSEQVGSDVPRATPSGRSTAGSGKALSSEQTGSGTQRTSRQQTSAAKKAKEQEKRAGKSVAVATDEESGDESADEQAPTKRAKMSKGKEVAATSIGCSSMHSTHGSKLVMSPRKTCDCSARLSAPTPPLECCPFQALTSMLPSGWSASS